MQPHRNIVRDDARRRASRIATVLLAATTFVGATSPACASDFGASWTGDFASVLSGGLREDERHLGFVELTFDHVFRPAGRDVALHVAAQHVYGGGLSERLVGDLQNVSNADADGGTRVLQAWVDVPLGDAWSLKLGRYDLNSEFDAIEPAGLFLNASHGIGPDISQTGAAGPSIFPHTAFGLRLQYSPGERHTVRGVALDVESDPDADYGDTPFLGGTLFALEYQFGHERTRWTAGAWSFTRSRTSVATSTAGARDREYGAYGAVQRRLDRNWNGYLRVGVANEDASRIGAYAGAGIVHEGGLLAARDDSVGLAVGHARNGGAYRDAMRAEGIATAAAETAIELTWRVPLGEYVTLQPDLQYVVDPDTDPAIDDALVAMLRVELAF
jgi:porin